MSQDALRVALKHFRKVGVSVLCFSMVMNLLLLVPALYMLQIYDRVLPSRNETTLWMLTGLVFGLYAMAGLLDYVRAMAATHVGRRLDEQVSGRVFETMFRQQLAQPRPHGTQALSDLAQVRQFIGGTQLFAFFDAPWIPVYLAVIYLFHPWMGLVAIMGTLLLVLLAFANEWLTASALARATQHNVQAAQRAASTLRHAETVRAMGMLPDLFEAWRLRHAKALDEQTRAQGRANSIGALTRFVKLGFQSVILGMGAWLVLQDALSAGMMIAGSILVGRALAPVEQLIAVWRGWTGTRQAYHRLRELQDRHPQDTARLPLPAPQGRLKLEKLSVVPPGGSRPVLQDITFELEPGDALAVIGPSGSGKSTLARALVGVWPPAAGSVRLDGSELNHWTSESLGPYLGYLPQTVELFDGTVAENIARFGTPDPEQVVEAAQRAGVHELIQQLPQGYDTLLGDNGVGLSGGQQQRVALARALYRSPRLLVLDEPNAFLDDAGEQALRQAVARMRERGSTTVIFTHRPQMLATANKLLVLHEGKTRMFGPRDQLLAKLSRAPGSTPASATNPATPSV